MTSTSHGSDFPVGLVRPRAGPTPVDVKVTVGHRSRAGITPSRRRTVTVTARRRLNDEHIEKGKRRQPLFSALRTESES